MNKRLFLTILIRVNIKSFVRIKCKRGENFSREQFRFDNNRILKTIIVCNFQLSN